MSNETSLQGRPLAAFVDDLQARGRYTFARAEVTGVGGRSPVAVEAALRRLKVRGRVVSPRRGFYVVVPVEYRAAGCPPASWFIDDLMRCLGQPYYVGLLSAAALHGAGHQQPMLFQVVTDRPTRPAEAGRVRIAFHMNRRVGVVPVAGVQTETGSMRVSTPEATAYDLVRFAAAAGHLSNVATVLKELVEGLDPVALVAVADLNAVPVTQRLGYLLELIGEGGLAAPLHTWLQGRRFRAVPLVPGHERGSARPEARWRVIANERVEVDL